MAEQAAPPTPLAPEPPSHHEGGERPSIGRRVYGIVRDLAIFACLFLLLSTIVGRLRAPDLDGAAPPLSLISTDGEQVSLADLRGKTVVLNFWATWCGPCRAEIPMLSAFAEANADEVVLLGVAVDGTFDELKAAKEKLDIRYPVLVGDKSVAQTWGAKVLPTTVVVDPEGQVKTAHVGIITNPQLKLAVW
jgi:thiol-disulfide isomerase/thioredoxin